VRASTPPASPEARIDQTRLTGVWSSQLADFFDDLDQFVEAVAVSTAADSSD
jgi:hypothetical protein